MNKYHRLLLAAALLTVAIPGAATAPAVGAPLRLRPHASISGSAWTFVGPTNLSPISQTFNGPGLIAGRVNAVAPDPSTSSTYYAATDGGVFKSVDSGTTWAPMSDNAPWTALATNALAVNAANPNEVWAGTGDSHAHTIGVGTGLMKSSDGGVTWSNVGASQFANTAVTSILIDPETPTTVTVSSAGGTGTSSSSIWRSTDSGATWTAVLSRSADWLGLSASISKAGQRIYYAVGRSGPGGTGLVYTSQDRGATWAAATVPFTSTAQGAVAIAASQIDGATVYAVSVADQKVYKSTDGAVTWADITNNGIPTWGSIYDASIAVSAVQPTSSSTVDAVFVGVDDLSVTVNGGTAWTTLGSVRSAGAKTSGNQHGISFLAGNPDFALVANDGGVYGFIYDATGANPGNTSTFVSLNADLGIGQVNHAAYSPSDRDVILAALGDPFTETSAGASTTFPGSGWSGVPGGSDAVVSPNGSSVQYASGHPPFNGFVPVFSTTDAWSSVNEIALFTSGDQTPLSPVLAYDATNGLLYTGTDFLYRYSERNGQWSGRLGGQQLAQPTGDTIDAIAIAPSDPNTIYTGSTLGQVWATHDQGLTWLEIGTGGAPLPTGGPITSISVSPNSSSDVLVTIGSSANGRVFHCANVGTTSGTSTWTNITGSLPDVPAYSIVRDIDTPDTAYYVGMASGVYYSTDSGGSWTNGTHVLGLPIIPVTDLKVSASTRVLSASTLGRGIWQLNIPSETPTLTSISPSTGVVNGPNVVITVVGAGFFTGSVVEFNNTPLVTVFNSQTSLMATIPGSLLIALGTDSISVVNPSPGNASNTATFTVTNPTPIIVSLSPPGVVFGSQAFTLTVNGSGFFNGSQVDWNGVPVPTTFVSSSVLHASIATGMLSNLATITVTVDNGGGLVSNGATFQVGNPAPSIRTLAPSNAVAGSPQITIDIGGTGLIAGSQVNWTSSLSGTTTVLSSSLSGSGLIATVTPDLLAAGQVVSITVTNPGPGGGTSLPLTFIVGNPVPTITQIAPAAVGAGSGDLAVTITGSNFAQGALVSLSGTFFTPTTITPTSIVVTVPAAAMAVGGDFQVTVVNGAPLGGTSNVKTFEVDNPIPSISSISPNSASAGSNAVVLVVNGNGFVQTSLAEWNGQPLATTYVSAGRLTAVVPAALLTTGAQISVTVVNPTPSGGSSNLEAFTITNPAPTLASLNPAGAATGGAQYTVTVTGTNFVPGSIVNWNGSPLATTYLSGTSLQAIVTATLIASAGSATVLVVNPPPAGGASNSLTVEIANGVPTVTGVTPASVVVGAPATTITVNGANYAANATVVWQPAGSGPPTSLVTTVISGSQLTAIVPANLLTSAGTVSVLVTNVSPGGGTSISSGTFSINNPQPVVSTLSPNTVLAGSSDLTVTIGGAHFAPGAVVKFNQTAVLTTVTNANLLTAVIPAVLIQTAGSFAISVTNPAPGGGKSASSLTLSATSVHTFPAGLQMLSAPYDYSGSTFDSLLGVTTNKFAIWQPLLGVYAVAPSFPADTFRLGSAYWADLTAPATLQVQGTPAPTGRPYAVDLLPTWNQIADPFPAGVRLSSCTVQETGGGQPVSFADASDATNNFIFPTLYSYDPSSNVYVPHFIGNPAEPDPVIQPYMGYWIAAKTSCTLNVANPPGF